MNLMLSDKSLAIHEWGYSCNSKVITDNLFIADVCDFIEAQNPHCFQYQGSKNIAIVDRPLTCPEEAEMQKAADLADMSVLIFLSWC